MHERGNAVGHYGLLSRRWAPLTLAVGILVSVGSPVLFYTYALRSLGRTAAGYAEELATRFGSVLPEAPMPWKAEVPEAIRILHDFQESPQRSVLAIRVLDEAGRPVPGYAMAVTDPRAWWSVAPAVGTARILSNRRMVGSVEVGLSQEDILRQGLAFFVFAGCMGGSLLVLIYRSRVRAVPRETPANDRPPLSEAERAADPPQLGIVRAVCAEIARGADLTTLLPVIIQRTTDLIGAAGGTLYLWDEEKQMLVPRAGHGAEDWRGQICLRSGEGVAGAVMERREGLIINEYWASPYGLPSAPGRAGFTAILAEPIIAGHRLLGVIVVDHGDGGRRFAQQDREVISLMAAQAAIAFENARLIRELTERCHDLRLAREELFRSEKSHAVCQAATDVVHGLNTRLAILQGKVQSLQLRTSEPEIQNGLAMLETSVTECAQAVRGLRGAAAHSLADRPYPPVVSGEDRSTANVQGPARPSPCRVLLVDDDPLVRRTLAQLLRSVGHTVAEADGGVAALAILRETPTDLILTDLGMPELTGWDVARVVKEQRPQLPVVLVTGQANSIAADQAERRLVDAILQKPCRLEEIQAVIGRVTGKAACAAACGGVAQ